MQMSPDSFEYIRRLLTRRAGIVIDTNKRYLVKSRLAPIARRENCDTLDALVERLQMPGNSRIVDEVVEAMTTNETSFFRDAAPFDTLREVVLPGLFGSNRTLRQLTVWCAGCSAGQEPYSIAMLLREHFASRTDWQVRILGTDLSERVLQQARSGCYGAGEITRGLPVALRDKYFQRCATRLVCVR